MSPGEAQYSWNTRIVSIHPAMQFVLSGRWPGTNILHIVCMQFVQSIPNGHCRRQPPLECKLQMLSFPVHTAIKIPINLIESHYFSITVPLVLQRTGYEQTSSMVGGRGVAHCLSCHSINSVGLLWYLFPRCCIIIRTTVRLIVIGLGSPPDRPTDLHITWLTPIKYQSVW